MKTWGSPGKDDDAAKVYHLKKSQSHLQSRSQDSSLRYWNFVGIPLRKRRPRFLLSWMNDMTMVQLNSLYDSTLLVISYKANLGTRKVVTCTYSIFFVCLFVFVVSRRCCLFFKKEKFCVFDKKKTVKKRLRLGRCSRLVSSVEIAPVCEAAKLERVPV